LLAKCTQVLGRRYLGMIFEIDSRYEKTLPVIANPDAQFSPATPRL